MAIQRTYHSHSHSLSKQRGATLITALSFLALMTIVSVSATKISILDILAASNDQQQSLLYQRAENKLIEVTTVPKLYKPMVKKDGASFSETTGEYLLPSASDNEFIIQQKITDKKVRYECNGFNGKALSLGPSVPRCDLYDFEATIRKQNTGSKARHNRGAGKEKPNSLKNSYLTD